MLEIRKAFPADEDDIWFILQPVIEKGLAFAFPSSSGREEVIAYWCSPSKHTYIALKNGQAVGVFFIQDNQPGRGSHIANAAYAIAATAGGMGIGKQMGEYSLAIAKDLGYSAMQFNLVVKSNERAVQLWQSIGFIVIGEIPEAFDHPENGLTNAYIMYRKL